LEIKKNKLYRDAQSTKYQDIAAVIIECNLIKYKIVYDYIIYIYIYTLYYILAYIRHNRDISLENPKVVTGHTSSPSGLCMACKPAVCCAGLA